LNHGPLPYQISSRRALACSCPGERQLRLPASDPWQLRVPVHSGTPAARAFAELRLVTHSFSYLLVLENVFRQPAQNLGFASERYGVNRKQLLAEAGLTEAMPLPDPAESYGPLSGIWLSAYEY
jgi:hypothetical protein